MALPALETADWRDIPVMRVWRNADYARYMSGTAPYYVTSWMQRIAIGWLGWELSHSYAWVGAIAAADLAPMMILGPIAGAVADRTDPLRLLRWTQFGMVLQAVLVAVLVVAGAMTPLLLFSLSLITGCLQPVYTAARQTIVPRLVAHADLASAVSLDASFFHGSRFIGPALAAVTIDQIGIAGTSFIHVLGCLYFYAMACMISVAPPRHAPHSHGSLLIEITEAVTYVRRHAGFMPLFMMMTVASIVARPLQDMLPGFAGHVFLEDGVVPDLHEGARGLAWLTSSMGIGSLTAAVFLALRGRAEGMTGLAITALCGLGIATFGFVATRHLVYAVAFSTLFGFTMTLVGVSIQALVQVAVSDALRGRVMSLYALVFRGLPAVGAVLIGGLAEHIGLRSVFALSALVCLAAWLTVAPRASEIERAVRVQ